MTLCPQIYKIAKNERYQRVRPADKNSKEEERSGKHFFIQTNRKKRQTGLKRNLEANLANREISKIVSGQNQFLRVAILSVKKGLLRRNFFHFGVDRPFLDEKFVKSESRESGCLWFYRALKNCFWLPTRADPSRKDGISFLGIRSLAACFFLPESYRI